MEREAFGIPPFSRERRGRMGHGDFCGDKRRETGGFCRFSSGNGEFLRVCAALSRLFHVVAPVLPLFAVGDFRG